MGLNQRAQHKCLGLGFKALGLGTMITTIIIIAMISATSRTTTSSTAITIVVVLIACLQVSASAVTARIAYWFFVGNNFIIYALISY